LAPSFFFVVAVASRLSFLGWLLSSREKVTRQTRDLKKVTQRKSRSGDAAKINLSSQQQQAKPRSSTTQSSIAV